MGKRRRMCPHSMAVLLQVTAFLMILPGCGGEPGSSIVAETTRRPSAHVLGDTQVRARDGMDTVYVPAGQFEMGMSDAQVDQALRVCNEAGGDCERKAFRTQQPAHTVTLDAFWIDQTEVTNAMYAAFLGERGNQVEEGVPWLEPGAGHDGIVYGHLEEVEGAFRPEAGYEDHPVIEVSWYGAAAYCAWAGARLPTEAEWAYAARGPEAQAYPWGDTYDGAWTNACDTRCPYRWRDTRYDDGAAQWASVGSYPDGASWCGVLDMSGNVWEWVNDRWSEGYYARSPAHDPQGPASGTLRIARGGSWFDESWRVSATSRKALTPSSYRMHWVGFRCAVSAGAEE
jgi:formylglycine-generating enzyme required for sulfatase activity